MYMEKKIDSKFEDNDLIKVGNVEIKVISTPGHTIGGVCYLIEDMLFSGDTLFRGSIGRTDFPDSDHRQLWHR